MASYSALRSSVLELWCVMRRESPQADWGVETTRARASRRDGRLLRVCALLGAHQRGDTPICCTANCVGVGGSSRPNWRFTFSEDLDPAFSAVRILDVRGAVVDPGPGTIDPTDPAVLTISIAHLAVGSYVAAIRVRSADGHFVEYRVPFQVGSGTSAIVGLPPLGAADPAGVMPPLAETLPRWLSLIGAALAGGAVTFALVVRRPGRHENLAADGDLSVWLRRLLLAGALAVIAGSCLLVVAQAATGAGVPWWGVFGRPLGQELGAHAGRILSVRAITALLLAVVAWSAARESDGTSGSLGPRRAGHRAHARDVQPGRSRT